MPPELKRFFTYWSLTFAVLIFYTLAALVAGLDIWEKIMDNVRKRRAQLKPKGPLLDPNPLKGMNIAATIGMGPGQQPNEKRQWVLDRATEVAKRLKLNVGILVLEDNKEHPLVQITDAKSLKAYRVDKTWVAEARAGNVEREGQIKDLLERYLASDFLGIEDVRPKRTTELAREAAAKPSPAARPAQAAQETPATESQDPE
ncbi:MAG: hypothetical protein ACRDFA_13150 [bacterium]